MTGNLKSRNLHGTEEYFFYDTDNKELNRLTGAGPDENTINETYSFADNGNIMNKAGMGPYEYDNDRKNAVTQVGMQQMGSQVDLQNINYNHFNSAALIHNLNNDLQLVLEYGPDDQRRKAVYTEDGDDIKTRIYAGSYEKQKDEVSGEIREVHYISAGGQLVAMFVLEDEEDVSEGEYSYPHQDHLGSIIYITDESGNLIEDDFGNTIVQSFDAWGRPRNPDDLSYSNIPERPDWLWRGYTGHEHLDEFGLINMNGRLYDPVVGRMLSPDNYIQSPDFSQSYNRYSYVWNNPLKYTDPSGELITWNIGNGGLSVGFNLSPVGVPVGAGINIGWGGGFSAGVYGEVGYRVGGTGLGSGITVSQNLNYNFQYGNWSTTTSIGAYASLGPVSVGGNLGSTHDFSTGTRSSNWGIYAGLGLGFHDGRGGLGITIGYGSDGWTYGLGGSYYANPENVPGQRTVSWDEYETEGLPDVWQCGENGCIYASLAAIDASFGFDGDKFYIQYDIFGDYSDNLVNIIKAVGKYLNYRGLQSEGIVRRPQDAMLSLSEINERMRGGQRTIINRSFEGNVGGHSMVLKSVSQKVVTRSNGTVVPKNQFRFKAMDPFYGRTVPVSNYVIRNSHGAFFIFK